MLQVSVCTDNTTMQSCLLQINHRGMQLSDSTVLDSALVPRGAFETATRS